MNASPVDAAAAPDMRGASEPARGAPARVELHIRRMTLPAGLAIRPDRLAGLIRQRVESLLDPRHDAAPPAGDRAIEALLDALGPQLLAALRSQGFDVGARA